MFWILFISNSLSYVLNLWEKRKHQISYSHCWCTLSHPAANKFFHNWIARLLLMRLRVRSRGIPFFSSLPLSISTFGFASQLSQSYLNLRIHTPLGSLSHPSRFIILAWTSTSVLFVLLFWPLVNRCPKRRPLDRKTRLCLFRSFFSYCFDALRNWFEEICISFWIDFESI